jgi:3',5'-cyclic AMP phosphodiesterase CpdA
MAFFSTLSFWRRLSLAAATAVLFSGCELLEFSPNDFRGPEALTNLTQKNLDRLAAQRIPPGDTLRFVFTGDSQRFYNEADGLVASVSQQPGVSLMVVAGDISDFGLAREMRWVAERLNRLTIPYLTVVGNHDHVGNGRAAYQQIFGPLNYSFVYGDTKFIFIDTNSREYNFNGRIPDVPWLQAQVSDLQGARRQVVMSHVPPQDFDFDQNLTPAYTRTLAEAPKLAFELNGHRHDFSIGQPFDDGVTYINSYSFEENQYLIISLWNDANDKPQFRLKKVSF